MFLNEARIEEVKNVLYHHYKTDASFPRSCGSVSMALAYLFEMSDLSKEYEVSYQRGHYRNDNDEWGDECHEFDFTFKRGDNLESFPCLNCSCDYMVGHSWIELESKVDKEIIILDFTSIQFEEDFYDYQDELFSLEYSKNELYDYIAMRSKFVVRNEDYQFDRYINSERTYTGRYLIQAVEDTVKNNGASDLTILLERLGYFPNE